MAHKQRGSLGGCLKRFDHNVYFGSDCGLHSLYDVADDAVSQ